MTIATSLTLVSMWCYPGGTTHDASTSRYSLTQNFLSDLGMTVAYDHQANKFGASLFILSLCTVLAGLGAALVAILRLLFEVQSSRRWARAVAVSGLFVCTSFVGVAFTPENRAMALHLAFTLFAFRALPLLSLFLAIAAHHSGLFPRRVSVVWALLTVALTAYVGLLGWGPSLTTTHGLAIQVIGQKVITIISFSVFVFQCLEANRVWSRSR